MLGKCVLAVVLVLGFGATAIMAAEPEGTKVTVKGILQEDKNGFFLKAGDGMVYDIRINDESKADMHKFYTGLEGDMVKVSGVLFTEETADKKPYQVVYSDDITRLKGERVAVVAREGVVVERPVVVREVYVEQPHSIHVPGVLHINW
jgi:hypothetical protein